MRNIKFRGWDKRLKKFFAPHYAVNFYVSAPNEYDIQEWTGVKDSDGKDIYEGDILTIKNGAQSEVKFLNGSFFVFGNPISAYFNDDGSLGTLFLKVKTNIYEISNS